MVKKDSEAGQTEGHDVTVGYVARQTDAVCKRTEKKQPADNNQPPTQLPLGLETKYLGVTFRQGTTLGVWTWPG